MERDMAVRIGTLLVAFTIAVSACSGTDEIASRSVSPREAQTSSPQHPELPKIMAEKSQRDVDMRLMFGQWHYRASAPFLQCIMFGWFFALLVGLGTNLFWQKRKIFPWIIPWCVLPVGIIVSIAGGPMMLAALSMVIIGLFPFRKFWKPACVGSLLNLAFHLLVQLLDSLLQLYVQAQ